MKGIRVMIMSLAMCWMGGRLLAQSIDAMFEQVTALKALIHTAEKGYQIAEDGLHTIRDIKDGEFNLHRLFFSSLSAVNPAVRNMPQADEIISLQPAILKQFSTALAGYRKTGLFSAAEIGYMEGINGMLVNLGSGQVGALQVLLADGGLKMTDGERIRRIDAIDGELRNEYEFVQAFTQEASLLLVQRQKEAAGIGILRQGTGVK